MTEYLVKLEIDVDGKDPFDAAHKVASMLATGWYNNGLWMSPLALRAVYDVTDKDNGGTTSVDLDFEE